MHRLLRRQLKWVYGKGFDPAEPNTLHSDLLDYISQTYEEHDKERRHFEHTLDLNTTELNESNAEMKKLLRLLSEAQRLSHTGSWNLTLEDGTMEWSAELYRILGLEEDSPNPGKRYTDLIHSDDREKADTDEHRLSPGFRQRSNQIRT